MNAESYILECFCSQKNIPEFKIEPEIALELLMASNYLDTWSLYFAPEKLFKLQ